MLAKQNKQMEDFLLDQYGGNNKTAPKTLLFDHITPATRLLEKRRQMFEVWKQFISDMVSPAHLNTPIY